MAAPLPPETKVGYDNFDTDPMFDHVVGTNLAWLAGPKAIGGSFDRTSPTWDRYADSLDQTYTDEHSGIELEAEFEFAAASLGAIFHIGFMNKSTAGSSPYINLMTFKFYDNQTGGNNAVMGLSVYDDAGNAYNVASSDIAMVPGTRYRVIMVYDQASREVTVTVQRVSDDVVIWTAFVTVPSGVHFQLDAAGLFIHKGGGAPYDQAIYAEIFTFYAIDIGAEIQPDEYPKEYEASIVHISANDDGSNATDLINIGVAKGDWSKRESDPATLTLDLLNKRQRYNVRFNHGDIVKLFLGRDGLIEPEPIVWGRIKNDITIDKQPGRDRVSVQVFGLLQDLADMGVWLWKRADAPWLTKGYSYDPTPGTWSDDTLVWQVDDNIGAGPPKEIDAAIYVGGGVKFRGIRYETIPLRTGHVCVFEYWDLDTQSWEPLDVYEDEGNYFNPKGTFNTRWHMPHNWGPTQLTPDSVPRYWIRARTTALGTAPYSLDFIKLLNDYNGQYVEFAIEDIVNSVYGQRLKTTIGIRQTIPSIIVSDDNMPTSDGGAALGAVKALAALAFVDRYPYGLPLPYFIGQENNEFIFKPHSDPGESFYYGDKLTMGENLLGIKAVIKSETMANEVIVQGATNLLYGTVEARGSIRKNQFVKTRVIPTDSTSEGELLATAIKIAQESEDPAVVLMARVLGMFSIPIGAIVSIVGADQFDGKYIVKEASGSFAAGAVSHVLILKGRESTILEAIQGG